MLRRATPWACLLFTPCSIVLAQQQCYFGPGADNRGPSELVPCSSSGQSSCCLLGDTCLSGNTCYNYETGDLYQYGCTDITYEDDSCPYKCGFNTTLSPWTAMEYCSDVQNVTDTWVCHAPESCGCDWNSTESLLMLQPRGCKEMGMNARVALYAPSTLAPYVSLPSTFGGTTSYYKGTTINGTSTWISTAVAGYTPATITQLTTYGDQPSSAVLVVPGVSPAPSTNVAPHSVSATATTGSSASATASPTTTSPGNSTSPPASSASSGLSVGAKAGIGAEVGGGVLLLAAVALAAFLWGKQYRRQKSDAAQQALQQGPRYPGSPPMQQPYYPSPGEKPGWQGGYPMGQPLMQQTPYFAQGQMPPHHDVQPMYGSVPSPPIDEVSHKSAPFSPPPAPMELAAEQPTQEMESSPVNSPLTPSPAYAEVTRQQA